MLQKRVLVFLMFVILIPLFPSKVKADGCEIVSFNAFPSVIYASSYLVPGQVSMLTWLTSGCNYVELVSPGQNEILGSAVTLEGNTEIGPFTFEYPNTKNYILVAYGDTGQTSLSLTIYLTQYPASCEITAFQADSYQVNAGASTNLSWYSTNCSTLYLNGVLVSSNGSQSITPQTDTTYTLTDNQNQTRSLTVVVSSGSDCSLVYYGPDPNYIDEFGNASVTWSATGSCSISLRSAAVYFDQGEPNFGTHYISNANEGDVWTLSFGSSSHSITLQRHVNCAITGFSATNFDPGQSTNISATTSACDHAVIAGGNFGSGLDISNQLSAGRFQIADIPQTTTTYTLQAWSSRNQATPASTVALENTLKCSIDLSRSINSAGDTSFDQHEYIVEIRAITSLVVSVSDARQNILSNLDCSRPYTFILSSKSKNVAVSHKGSGFRATGYDITISTVSGSVVPAVIPYRTDAKLEIY
ncbi:MAG: hypothetical protein ACYC5G_02790 [Candidatus Doudnabacteria bacterium]